MLLQAINQRAEPADRRSADQRAPSLRMPVRGSSA
jgi:hypothetical protein